MLRDAHTLKGDARLVNFDDVLLLCDKLEDLLMFASERRYLVSSQIDITVSMTLQFIGLLARKQAGMELAGIDLEGLASQVEEAMASAVKKERAGVTDPIARPLAARPATVERVCPDTRLRLAASATTAYLEHLNAFGASRRRLYALWSSLCREVASLEATPLAAVLERHVAGTRELASKLGKRAELRLDVADLRASAEVAEALDVALLHALRNAIDHGIEAAGARAAAGKPATGVIVAAARLVGDAIELRVEDDGQGLDPEEIRTKAVASGAMTSAEAARAGERQLCEVVFRTGFSTRAEATDVSGRGVGLHAVKKIVEGLGGSVALDGQVGRGVALNLRVPRASRQIEVHRVSLPRAPVPFALPTTWRLDAREGPDARLPGVPLLDPLRLLELSPDGQGEGRASSARHTIHTADQREAIALRVAELPDRRSAQRMCPTSESYPVEVVSIEGEEAILLRPDQLRRRPAEPGALHE